MTSTLQEIEARIKNRDVLISVFGLGRIGLPTAAIFANAGFKVNGIDINSEIITLLNQGKTILDEPGLVELVKKSTGAKMLQGLLQSEIKNLESDVFIICVPTPVTENKVPDYSDVLSAIEKIGEILKKGDLVIVESTTSPGTVENLLIPRIERNSQLTVKKDFWIVSCPERANPGEILHIFQNTPRIIGGIDQKSTDVTFKLYREVMSAEIIKVSNPKTANAVKLTENIFRDVNIALMNEISILYEKLGIDTFEIIKAASSKWNFVPHFPGAGVGGPCLPANPYYLIQEGMKVGFVPHLIRFAREINDRMPAHLIELILDALNEAGKTVKNANICLLGMSYKENIGDAQVSPFFPIYNALRELKANIKVHDPHFLNKNPLSITIESSIENALEDADCIVFITAHDEFKKLRLENVQLMASSPLVIVDGRNVTDNKKLPKGTIFRGIGRLKSSDFE